MTAPGLVLAFSVLVLVALMLCARRLRRQRFLHVRGVALGHRITGELSRERSDTPVAKRVLDIVMEHTEAAIGMLWVRDPRKAGYLLAALEGLPERLLKPGDPLEAAETGFGLDCLQPAGRPVLVHRGLRKAAASHGVRLDRRQNMLCMPIGDAEHPSGIMQLVCRSGSVFGQRHLEELSDASLHMDTALQYARRLDRFHRERDVADSLYRIGTTISRFLDLDEILRQAVAQNMALMRAGLVWYLTWPNREEPIGEIQAAAGALPDDWAVGDEVPLGARAIALLSHTGSPERQPYVLIRDLPGNRGEGPPDYSPRQLAETFCETEIHAVLTRAGIRSGVLVPVGEGNRVRGLLCSFSDRLEAYDEFDVAVQHRVANQLLIALNTAELSARGRRLAATEERLRLSDELHDDMSQIITGLSLELHALERLRGQEGETETFEARLAKIHDRLDDAKAAMRGAIFELRLPDGQDLWANLRTFCERFQQWHGLRVQNDLPGQIVLDIERQRDTIRFVQEALWNVKKHAGIGTARVSGHREGSRVSVEISDQGRGMDTGHRGEGQGLATLKDRAQRLGGTLTIARNRPNGVKIRLEFHSDER